MGFRQTTPVPSLSKEGNRTPSYDFDIHQPNSFMYYFTRQYMDETCKLLKSLELDLKDKIVYDIGIGRGRSLALFKALGVKKVVGFDVNDKEADYARKQIKRLRMDVKIVLDDFDNSKLKSVKSNSCEVIGLMNILFCVPNDQVRRTLISETKRILKPGGVLIVVDMQKPSLMWLFSLIFHREWKFRSYGELLQLMKPLSLIGYAPSNHFYFVNGPVNLVNRLLAVNICYALNAIFKFLRVPASTRTFVFKKGDFSRNRKLTRSK